MSLTLLERQPPDAPLLPTYQDSVLSVGLNQKERQTPYEVVESMREQVREKPYYSGELAYRQRYRRRKPTSHGTFRLLLRRADNLRSAPEIQPLYPGGVDNGIARIFSEIPRESV